MADDDRWTPWKRHDGKGNPAPVGLPLMIEAEGVRGPQEHPNEDGPWWTDGVMRRNALGYPVEKCPRIIRYRERRYEAGIMLIRRLTNGGENA